VRVLYSLVVLLVACGDVSPTAPDAARPDADVSSPHDATTVDAVSSDIVARDKPEPFCVSDPRVQTLVGGVERLGMTVTARRESAAPAGSARTLYTWTVALRSAAGPLPDDATLGVSLRMPDHGHGARRPPTVRPLGGGRFELADLDLFMDGVWTVTLRVSVNGVTDQVVFGVCIG
jgi:hypothetical protein